MRRIRRKVGQTVKVVVILPEFSDCNLSFIKRAPVMDLKNIKKFGCIIMRCLI